MSDSYLEKRVVKLDKLVAKLQDQNQVLKDKVSELKSEMAWDRGYRTNNRSLDSRLDCTIRSGDSLNTLALKLNVHQ